MRSDWRKGAVVAGAALAFLLMPPAALARPNTDLTVRTCGGGVVPLHLPGRRHDHPTGCHGVGCTSAERKRLRNSA